MSGVSLVQVDGRGGGWVSGVSHVKSDWRGVSNVQGDRRGEGRQPCSR